MKNYLFIVLLFSINLIFAQNSINFIRVGESNPSTYAYVFGTGEQLSGQQFQTDGIVTYKGFQYTVYYNKARNVCISRRKLPLGEWQEVVLPYKNSVDDAHNVISMGICHKDGSIHLSYDHHNDDLHYCRSLETAGNANNPDEMEWKSSSFSLTTSALDASVPNVTYPRFISMPNGNLLFECRYRWSGYGDSYLREYDGDTKQWSLVGRYVQGEDVQPDACAYINGMTYDNLGRLHVTWCWRDDFGGGSNHDFYYAYSEDDGRTWKDTYGDLNAETQMMTPVFDSQTGTSLGQTKKTFMVEEIPYNKGYINQETQAVDSKGRIHAVNSQIPGTATDANWTSSRTKARLHHRFRDLDGTWKTILVKNNGQTVNSYCRVNLSFDAFDNAFVVANGAEVYFATDANGYDDWNLMSDVDNGRFISEPLVDRNLLLSKGVLSFVYLGVDNKITVIDYLLDNPNVPNGNGLKAQYFSDKSFENQIESVDNKLVSTSSAPQGTKSIKWSGSFETAFAEEYTLYLKTTAKSTVYVDGVKVLLTKKSSNAREYSFNFETIASHNHNIVIESEATSSDEVSLWWSSNSVEKVIIPASNLYSHFETGIPESQKKNDSSEFLNKEKLSQVLTASLSIDNKAVVNIPNFSPQGDYSVEIKAQVVSSPDCPLIFEGRAKNGMGFRVAIDETNIKWIAPFLSSKLLTVADNSEAQSYRIVVYGDEAFIYHNDEFLLKTDLASIGDIDEFGLENAVLPNVSNVDLGWAGPNNNGTDYPTAYGWENAVQGIAWNVANGGSGVRYLDVTSGHTYNGTNYQGRVLTIRWDGTYGVYSYPVQLEANTTYDFSLLYQWWNNGSPNSLNVAVSPSKDMNEQISSKSLPTAGKNVMQKGNLTFTTNEAGTYYLLFNGQSGVMYGVADLELNKLEYEPKLSVSKLCDGVSSINISEITYEDGAFSPGKLALETNLDKKSELETVIVENVSELGQSGNKNILTFPFNVSGDYSVEIAMTVANSVEGRGIDFQVRDDGGNGFRTVQNNNSLSWIAPFSQSKLMNDFDSGEQIIRYAVKDERVYVFQNGDYIGDYSKSFVGDMNDAGSAEIEPYSNASIDDISNIADNPRFSNTTDNGAPQGWTSNGTLGASPNARVQLKSSTTELSAYPDGTKAFVFRFDGTYQWFAHAVTLEANKWYEYSFDLITWGNNDNKTFNVIVSKSQAGNSDVIYSKQATTPADRATSKREIIRFKSQQQGTYYITLAKNGTLAGTAGLTNISLVEHPLNGILVGKNYKNGTAPFDIRYISIDTNGAFAPDDSSVGIDDEIFKNDVSWYVKDRLLTIYSSETLSDINVYNLFGTKISSHKSNNNTIEISIPKGLFLVKMTNTKGKSNVIKVLIE